MQPYKDNTGESGILEYDFGATYIIVKFRSGECNLYSYTYASAGADAVETMKELALKGDGLNSYISTYKPAYEGEG